MACSIRVNGEVARLLRGRSGVAALVASGLLLIAPAGSETAESSTSDSAESRNKALIQAKFDAWRDGTGSPFELLAEEASWTIVGRSAASRTYGNREEFMREVIRPFNARMRTPLKPTVPSLYAEGDSVVAFFDAESVAADGQPYRNTYAWFMDLRDGRIVRVHAFFDSVEFNELWERVTPAKESDQD